MKPTDLIIVMAYNAGDAPAAERLLDWIFELSGKKQLKRTIVLVTAPNTHPEMQTKVRLAAQVAFENVETYSARIGTGEKVFSVNQMFKTAAIIVRNNFRGSWLWLEPDCLPLSAGWLDTLEKEYANQPKRYFGPWMKFQIKNAGGGVEEKMCFPMVACYPNNAIDDLNGFCDVAEIPFYRIAGEAIVLRSTKCRLIQQMPVLGNGELSAIRSDAVLLHSDKAGTAMEFIRSTLSKPKGRVKSTAAATANENQETG